MRRLRTTAVALLTTPALTGLAACSSDDGPDDGSSGGSAGSSSGEAGAPTAAASDTPPALGRPRPAQRAISVEACPPGEGELTARGTVRNREKKARDFVLTIEWLDEQSKVAASKVAVLEAVPPGEPTPWEVSATLDVVTTACTARASSGSLLD
ncbi:hypothetical protein ABFT23_04120 [Nocardioides sp. C4-1]|uniref:hypothetical protein n=1 Tax=Nocardioides sp. C4-1 TaxID=3151851 RepID=UPI0032675F01